MKKTIALVAFAATVAIANAAIIQTLPGPFAASNGVNVAVVDTSNDTGDWIDDLATGTTIFVGFDWTIDDSNGVENGYGSFFGGLSLYAAGTDYEHMLIGNGWNQTTYSVSTGSSRSGDTGVPYVVGNTVRLVARITTDGGDADDFISLWVNPTAADLASPQAICDPVQLESTGHFYSRAGNDTGAATIENVTISDDFASAISGVDVFVPVTIVGWDLTSGNIMKMVVDAPSLADQYYPKATTDLEGGNWVGVPHSDDGVNPFVITNLSYSTAEGTNVVIYVQADDVEKFFGIGEE